VSDVDLGLVLDDPLRVKDRVTIRAVARSVKDGGSVLEQRLSVFWGTPATLQSQRPGGRFPPLDRLDLLDYGRLLTGRDVRAGIARPDGAELLVAGAEFALGYLGAGSAGLLDSLGAYVQYLDDHIARLQAVNCPRLAGTFRRWRDCLIA
jgi:hypothetical protein